MLRQLWQTLRGGAPAARQPHPGRRRPPRLEALEDRCVPAVTYHGGPLLTSAKVENYFYGGTWNSDPNQGRLNAFTATLVKSPFMAEMTELGYGVGRGSFDASFTTARNPGGTLTDAQVRSALQADISAGLIRSPDSQRLYVVYAPANTVVIDPLGDSSLNGLLGYHYSFAGRDAAGNPATVYYAVIAYPGAATNNVFAPGTATAFDSATVVTSHEVAEAVTDPAVNTSPAWYDGSTGQEIADIGQNAAPAGMLGYAVTLLGAQNDSLAAPPTFTSAQFSGSGLWRYSSLRGWVELSGATATAVATDPAGDVVASFGPSGLWKYTEETGWAEISTANAVAVAIDHSGDVAASFGAAGLWLFNVNTGWSEISNASANVVAMDARGDVTAGFGQAGLWYFNLNTGWSEISNANAVSVAMDGRGDVAATFGAAGLWYFNLNGGWAEISNANAVGVSMDYAGDVAATFGAAGLWEYALGAGWAEISNANANLVAMDYNGDVAAGFGAAGLWKDFVGYGWVELSTATATALG